MTIVDSVSTITQEYNQDRTERIFSKTISHLTQLGVKYLEMFN